MVDLSSTLLPPNSTFMERALEAAVSRSTDLDVKIADLWNVDKVHTSFLPYLAWSLGVELWSDQMNDDQKRQIIRDYLVIRSLRGTAGAIERAYKSLGLSVEVVEHPEVPFFFELKITGQIVTEELRAAMQRLTELLKPLRTRYFVGVSINYKKQEGLAMTGRITGYVRFLAKVTANA